MMTNINSQEFFPGGLGLSIIVSIIYHVAILDTFSIAVSVVLLTFYGTSRASRTFPGTYWPGRSMIPSLKSPKSFDSCFMVG